MERAKRNEGTSSAMSFGKMFGGAEGTPDQKIVEEKKEEKKKVGFGTKVKALFKFKKSADKAKK